MEMVWKTVPCSRSSMRKAALSELGSAPRLGVDSCVGYWLGYCPSILFSTTWPGLFPAVVVATGSDTLRFGLLSTKIISFCLATLPFNWRLLARAHLTTASTWTIRVLDGIRGCSSYPRRSTISCRLLCARVRKSRWLASTVFQASTTVRPTCLSQHVWEPSLSFFLSPPFARPTISNLLLDDLRVDPAVDFKHFQQDLKSHLHYSLGIRGC